MKFLLIIYTLFALNLNAQNILISTQNHPNEPSIILDPKNPHAMIAAANLNNYYLSRDTGRTWTVHTLSSPYGVWGDPALAVDTAGDFYFFHLSNPPGGNWIDRIVCQKTTDEGQSWSEGTYTGLNGTKAQDKEWPVIDPRNNNLYLTWTQFDDYGSADPLDSSTILFSKSLDGGATWSDAKRINKIAGDCIDSDNTVEGAVPAVGPNGEIYVAWAGPAGLVFNKSHDEGEHWLEVETLIDPMPGGWDYSIPGIYRSNGLPITLCDLSNSPYHGTVYVNWSDQRNGIADTDVWLSKSDDGGQTWSAPIRVNDDEEGHQQFFTWMTIDQTNGYLYCVFYHRREYTDELTDVYIALSTDGGNTFINRRISESPFMPREDIFFGDYTNITVHNGIVRPVWTRLHNGQLSIWTHLTNVSEIITGTDHSTGPVSLEFESYPNPTGHYFYVSYKLHALSKINITLLDLDGTIIKAVVKDVKKGYGKYVERIDLDQLDLVPGIYFIQLEIDGKVETLKQLVISP